jgi:hypothetical protein
MTVRFQSKRGATQASFSFQEHQRTFEKID